MHWIPNTIWDWTHDKNRIAELTGLTGDALHVHGGMLILMLTALVVRRWPWHWLPWLAVVLAETANEAYDMLQPFYPSDEGNLHASLHDFWLTLLIPTVIFVFGQCAARFGGFVRSVEKRFGKRANLRADIAA